MPQTSNSLLSPTKSIVARGNPGQVQIQDFVKGAQLPRPKIVSIVKWSHVSEAEA